MFLAAPACALLGIAALTGKGLSCVEAMKTSPVGIPINPHAARMPYHLIAKRSPGGGQSSNRGGESRAADREVAESDRSTPSPPSTPEAERTYSQHNADAPASDWLREVEIAQRFKRKESERRDRAFRKKLHPETRKEMRRKRLAEEKARARKQALEPSPDFQEEFDHVLNDLLDSDDPLAENIEAMLRQLIFVPGITRIDEDEEITEAEMQQYLEDSRTHDVPILHGDYTGRAQTIQYRYSRHLAMVGNLDFEFWSGGSVNKELYTKLMREVRMALRELKNLRYHFHFLFNLAKKLNNGEPSTDEDVQQIEGEEYKYRYDPATWPDAGGS